MISHPFMSPAQPVVHDHTFVEPDVPQHPMAAAAMNEAPANAHVDVDQP